MARVIKLKPFMRFGVFVFCFFLQSLFASFLIVTLLFVFFVFSPSCCSILICFLVLLCLFRFVFPVAHFCKATKEYLNQRGTKIRVFRVLFRAPFLPPPFPLIFPPLFPSGPVHSPTIPPLFTSPFSLLFLTPRKLRFRYPSDLGTL